MNKNLLWGSAMGIAGVSMFMFSAQNTLFKKTPEPTPIPAIFSSVKPTLQPTPTISSSKKIIEAKKLLKNGLFQEAINLISDEKKDSTILNILIEANIGQKKYNEAEKNIKKLLKIENNEKNISGYIRILLLKGDIQNAESLIPELSKGKEQLFYTLIISITKDEHEKAKKYATQLLKFDDYKKIATVFLDVYKTYESFRDGSPHYLKAMLANVFKTLDFQNLTIIYIKPTLEEYPDYRDAWIVIGNAYLSLKKFEIAERMLEKAVSLDPTHPISPYLLGVTLYELGESEDAIEQIKTAIKNGYPEREKAERLIADIYFSLKQYEDSLEHYQYILNEGKPILSDYTKSVYIALQELKTPQLALSFARQAEKNLPTSPEALSLRAWTLIKEDKTDEALQLLLNLKNTYGDNPSILLYLAQIYDKQNNPQKALDTYEKCYNTEKNSGIGLECAQKYEELRKRLQEE